MTPRKDPAPRMARYLEEMNETPGEKATWVGLVIVILGFLLVIGALFTVAAVAGTVTVENTLRQAAALRGM